MQIKYAGSQHRFGELEIRDMFGSSALGCHRLGFNIHVGDMPPAPEGPRPCMIGLSGRVSVAGPQGGDLHLARLAPSWSLEVGLMPYANKTSFQVDAELTASQIEALEDVRCGAGLSFLVTLTGMIQHGPDSSSFLGQMKTSVNQGTWVELLRQMGYSDVLLLEVPRPDRRSCPDLADIVDHLGEGHRAFREGRWPDTVAACRKAVEGLMQHFEDPDVTKTEMKDWFAEQMKKTLADRYALVRKATFVLCAPSAHNSRKGVAVQWSREDAHAVLSMAAAQVSIAMLEAGRG